MTDESLSAPAEETSSSTAMSGGMTTSMSGDKTTTTASPSSSIFVAVQSGAFDDPLTWANGVIPSDDSSITIGSGWSFDRDFRKFLFQFGLDHFFHSVNKVMLYLCHHFALF